MGVAWSIQERVRRTTGVARIMHLHMQKERKGGTHLSNPFQQKPTLKTIVHEQGSTSHTTRLKRKTYAQEATAITPRIIQIALTVLITMSVIILLTACISMLLLPVCVLCAARPKRLIPFRKERKKWNEGGGHEDPYRPTIYRHMQPFLQ